MMTALTPPSRMSFPLLLSLGIHLAGVVWFMDTWLSTRVPTGTAPSLSIELHTAQSSPHTLETANTPLNTHASKSQAAAKVSAASRAEPAAAPAVPRRDTATPAPPDDTRATDEFEPPFLGGRPGHLVASAPDPAAQRNAALRNDVVNYLNQQFQHRFVYPYRARQRGWQGRVLVRIEVNQDGSLERIEVAESSGYDLLDRNAVETFRRIGQLKPALRTRLSENSQYAIPVIYRLTRG